MQRSAYSKANFSGYTNGDYENSYENADQALNEAKKSEKDRAVFSKTKENLNKKDL